jgi:hypothetical protein
MLEPDIKHALEKHLCSSVSENLKPHLIEELRLSDGAARADLVDVTEMHCYEIKSHKDSLRRLVGQGSRYIRVFDRITLVTHPKHVDLALYLIPSWWGILLVPDNVNGDFIPLREARLNTMQVSGQLAKILTKRECDEILLEHNLIKGRRSQSMYRLQEFIAENFTLDTIKDYVKNALRTRTEELEMVSVLLNNKRDVVVNSLQ